MGVLIANNAATRLASSLTTGATQFSVTAGDGAKFPAPSGGNWFPVTVIKSTGVLEIMRCTGRSGDVLTVARAQESTGAQAFSVGDRVELRWTAAAVADIVQQIAGAVAPLLRKDDNLAALTNKATARTNLGLGTAATANVQTSNTDATAAALMAVGAWGLGAAGGGPVLAPNSATRIGFSRYASGAAGAPVAGSGGSLLVTSAGGNFIQQISIVPGAGPLPIIDVRQFDIRGKPGRWVRLWHSGNASAIGNSLMVVASQAAARATIGSPAGVDKQMCTAWASFNGANGALRDSYNVSSVIKNGTGDYTVNFATALAHAEYAASGSARSNSASNIASVYEHFTASRTVSAVRMRTAVAAAGSTAFFDPDYANVSVFGGQK